MIRSTVPFFNFFLFSCTNWLTLVNEICSYTCVKCDSPQMFAFFLDAQLISFFRIFHKFYRNVSVVMAAIARPDIFLKGLILQMFPQ